MRRLFIINGLPGSGKGTQAEKVAHKLRIVHISSGQLIRDALKSTVNSEFLHQVRARYNAGIIQPNDVALKLVDQKISELPPGSGVIFDSFPINLSQARLLEGLIRKYDFQQPIFMMLNISADEAVKRLSTRKICTKCGTPYIIKDNSLKQCQKCGGELVSRSDDEESVVRARIDSYLPLLEDLKKYYQANGKLINIEGENSISGVYSEIMKVLDEK